MWVWEFDFTSMCFAIIFKRSVFVIVSGDIRTKSFIRIFMLLISLNRSPNDADSDVNNFISKLEVNSFIR